jgi:hypothetical protein
LSITSSKLGLTVDSTSDNFSTSQIAGNWDILDNYPGIYVGTTAQVATLVGTWGSAQTGMIVQETDGLSLQWRWNGSALVRTGGLGMLSSVQNLSGEIAVSNTPSVVLSTTVNIPAGGRTIEVKASATNYFTTSTAAQWLFTVAQDGTFIQSALFTLASGQQEGTPVFLYTTLIPSAGSHTYAFAVQTNGSSGFIVGDSIMPLVLSVVEQ